MRRTPLVGLLVGLTVLASACAGAKQPSASDLRAKVSTQVRDQDSRLTKAQADCYARLLVAKLGTKAINKLTVTNKVPDSTTQKALASAAIEATGTCHLPASTTTTVSTTTTAPTSTTSSTTTP